MANQTLHSPAKGQQISPPKMTDSPVEWTYKMALCTPIHSADDMPQSVLDDGYAAAQAWYVDMMERMETLCQEESARQGRNIRGGYCVNHGLHKAFSALPIAQRGAFLDAVGAYLMSFLAYGQPTKECRFTSDDLAMFASTPAEQDAWYDRHNNEEVTE